MSPLRAHLHAGDRAVVCSFFISLFRFERTRLRPGPPPDARRPRWTSSTRGTRTTRRRPGGSSRSCPPWSPTPSRPSRRAHSLFPSPPPAAAPPLRVSQRLSQRRSGHPGDRTCQITPTPPFPSSLVPKVSLGAVQAIQASARAHAWSVESRQARLQGAALEPQPKCAPSVGL